MHDCPHASARRCAPWAPAVLLAVGLLAGLIAGCGGLSTPPRYDYYRPWLFAVTVPESLVAGGLVPLWAHCSNDCGEVSLSLVPVFARPNRIGLAVWGKRRLDVLCFDDLTYAQPLAPGSVHMPVSGPLTVVIYGANDSLSLTLVPGAAPPRDEHVVELEHEGTHAPVADAFGYFRDWLDPSDTLATFRTDATGVARVAYARDPNAPVLWLFVPNAIGGVAAWARFLPVAPFCGKAVRTKLLVYGQPSAPSAPGSAVAWPASASMYAAGSPWWRRPFRMASR